ncbi:MAG: tyrosine-type recombinase/integrase [Candidatus Bathyarchaeota archaeon]|nr:tyrosine-type recombinase/integrase [Candidatus Bathyarchaeota archaeon]MDH5689885.1 tyrosine-type recombinase/integrase [Candidatus Bathyarchaeota archaeon]
MEKDWRKRSNHGYFVSAPKVFEPMLKDDSVQKWISKLKEKAGWRATAPVFLRTLYKFSEYCDKSPSELVASALREQIAEQPEELVPASLEVREVAQKFVNQVLNSGKRESARHTRACLTSFFRANNVSLHLDIIPKVVKKIEIIPSKEQVYIMADYTRSLRDRAIILCMYQSGLGITPLRNLNYGHVKEQIEKNKIPIRVHVTSDIVEKPLPVVYYVFFGAEACEALSAYLKERKRRIKRMREQGKKVKGLTPSSPLFASEGRNVPFGGRMAISSIWRIIKNSAEKTGLKKESVWPNLLRKAFKAELDRSPIDRDTKQFLKRHPVSDKKYNINEVEQKYLMCNLSRTKLDKLMILREFVRSLGIEELETKIKHVQAQIPQMTEEDALRFLIRTELVGVDKAKLIKRSISQP